MVKYLDDSSGRDGIIIHAETGLSHVGRQATVTRSFATKYGDAVTG